MTAQKNHWSDKRKIYVSIFRHLCQRLYHQYDAPRPLQFAISLFTVTTLNTQGCS